MTTILKKTVSIKMMKKIKMN